MSFNPGGGGTSKISTSQDVALNNLADANILSYQASTQKWVNIANTGGSGGGGNVFRSVWNGTSYDTCPSRSVAAYRDFIGPTDPSTISGLWADGDTWRDTN